jgi:hypothetical protein
MVGKATAFRIEATAALRSGRYAVSNNDCDAHFETAVSYKALAHDVEWLGGNPAALLQAQSEQSLTVPRRAAGTRP